MPAETPRPRNDTPPNKLGYEERKAELSRRIGENTERQVPPAAQEYIDAFSAPIIGIKDQSPFLERATLAIDAMESLGNDVTELKEQLELQSVINLTPSLRYLSSMARAMLTNMVRSTLLLWLQLIITRHWAGVFQK